MITIPLLLAVLALAVLDSASGDSADTTGTRSIAPSVNIDDPDVQPVHVRGPSFDIGGTFSGQVNSIDVAIDGTARGRALSREGQRWELSAARFSVTPGLHDIRVTATGDAGTDDDQLWVFYEPDPTVTFTIVLMPEAATYGPGDRAANPRLVTFGPGFGENFSVDLTVEAPPQVSADTNASLSTGSTADLTVDIVDPIPGVYPIVVRGVGENGDVQEATHTVTITGPEPTTSTTAAPATTAAAAGKTVVLFDDFEGPDQWTATTTASTNGAVPSAELAGGGNPGTMRRMTHDLPGTDDGENNPTQIAVVHIFNGGGWDPAVDGALARLNYSEDQIELEPPFPGAAIGTLFVLVQDGTRYIAFTNENNAFSNTTWQTTRVDGLTPDDFSPAPGPDFSANGAPMTFGYQRSNTSRSTVGIVTQHGIDNWTVELFGR